MSYNDDDLQSKLCFQIFMMMLSVKVIQIAGRMIVDYYDESLMICKVGNVFNYDGIIFDNSTVPQKNIFEIWDYFDNKICAWQGVDYPFCSLWYFQSCGMGI